jgi:hypothetical protein
MSEGTNVVRRLKPPSAPFVHTEVSRSAKTRGIVAMRL